MAISASINNNLRKSIYRRDGFRCALCDSTKYLQIHHVVPRGEGGPVANPHNLITLCADCHALAHGVNLRGLDLVERDGLVEQGIVEYLADYYANEGVIWNPWGKGGP